jgi:hypothetical protein
MFRPILKAGCIALTLCFVSGLSAPVLAQHHHHHGGGGGSSHHHHSGGGIYIGGGGIGIGYGSGFYGGGYRNYGYGYRGLGYSSPSYGYRSGIYVAPQVYVTPQYIAPAPRVVYQAAPTVIYQSPTVQPSSVTIQSSRIATPSPDEGQRTNLPGVTFGARAHLNVLADAVAERTTQLSRILNSSYQGNPQFQEVTKDAELLAASARQIPSLASDSQSLLAAVHDLNTLFNALSPAIESWQTNGESAASQLSRVKSALQLLSADAGYDPNQPVSSAPAKTNSPPVPPMPAPPEPTPVDQVPAP